MLYRVVGKVGLLRASSALVIVASMVVPSASRAGEPTTTNLELLTSMTTEVVNQLIDEFAPQLDGRGVVLSPHTNNEHYQFMNSIFTRELTARGITTYPNAPKEGTADLITFRYQASSFNLLYIKVYRSWLIGGKRVKRRAVVDMQGIISNEDGAVVWTDDARREMEDRFPHGDLGRVEEGSYQFTRPPLPEGGIGRYAEPVLVGGIVVGLIYLFFSNQSDS